MNIEPDCLKQWSAKAVWDLYVVKPGRKINAVFSTVPLHYGQFPRRKIVTYEDPVEYILGNENDLLHRIRQKSGVMWSVLLPDCVRCTT